MGSEAPSRRIGERRHKNKPYDHPAQYLLSKVTSALKNLLPNSQQLFHNLKWTGCSGDDQNLYSTIVNKFSFVKSVMKRFASRPETSLSWGRKPCKISAASGFQTALPLWVELASLQDSLSKKFEIPGVSSVTESSWMGWKETPCNRYDVKYDRSSDLISNECSFFRTTQGRLHFPDGKLVGRGGTETMEKQMFDNILLKPSGNMEPLAKNRFNFYPSSVHRNTGRPNFCSYLSADTDFEAKKNALKSVDFEKPSSNLVSFESTPSTKTSSKFFESTRVDFMAPPSKIRRLSTTTYQSNLIQTAKCKITLKNRSLREELEGMSASAKRIFHMIQNTSTPIKDAKTMALGYSSRKYSFRSKEPSLVPELKPFLGPNWKKTPTFKSLEEAAIGVSPQMQLVISSEDSDLRMLTLSDPSSTFRIGVKRNQGRAFTIDQPSISNEPTGCNWIQDEAAILGETSSLVPVMSATANGTNKDEESEQALEISSPSESSGSMVSLSSDIVSETPNPTDDTLEVNSVPDAKSRSVAFANLSVMRDRDFPIEKVDSKDYNPSVQNASAEFDGNKKINKKTVLKAAQRWIGLRTITAEPCTWVCSNCLIINPEDEVSSCMACGYKNHGVNNAQHRYLDISNNTVSEKCFPPRKVDSAPTGTHAHMAGDSTIWECDTCYHRNSRNTSKCFSCDTVKFREQQREIKFTFKRPYDTTTDLSPNRKMARVDYSDNMSVTHDTLQSQFSTESTSDTDSILHLNARSFENQGTVIPFDAKPSTEKALPLRITKSLSTKPVFITTTAGNTMTSDGRRINYSFADTILTSSSAYYSQQFRLQPSNTNNISAPCFGSVSDLFRLPPISCYAIQTSGSESEIPSAQESPSQQLDSASSSIRTSINISGIENGATDRSMTSMTDFGSASSCFGNIHVPSYGCSEYQQNRYQAIFSNSSAPSFASIQMQKCRTAGTFSETNGNSCFNSNNGFQSSFSASAPQLQWPSTSFHFRGSSEQLAVNQELLATCPTQSDVGNGFRLNFNLQIPPSFDFGGITSGNRPFQFRGNANANDCSSGVVASSLPCTRSTVRRKKIRI